MMEHILSVKFDIKTKSEVNEEKEHVITPPYIYKYAVDIPMRVNVNFTSSSGWSRGIKKNG